MKRAALLFLLLVPACGVGRGTAAAPKTAVAPARGQGAPAVVSREVDGDTIHVHISGGDEKVRFIGINTPETHGPGGLKECYGKEAATRMEEVLPVGTKVDLVGDVDQRDKYGRLLAYVYRDRDHLFVNLAMVQQGFAEAYTFPPNVAHEPEFEAAASKARDANRGLWGTCGGPHKPIN
jgi:micrococcal nuclease